jgi:hypothetical protein
MESVLADELAAHPHGSLFVYDVRRAIKTLKTSQYAARVNIEYKKILARRLIREGETSYREVARITGLSHETVRRLADY